MRSDVDDFYFYFYLIDGINLSVAIVESALTTTTASNITRKDVACNKIGR